jgi:hypothetical protein
MKIGNIDVFLEAVTIASARNIVLRKKFLEPETIGLIPTGGYSANNRYSKKALMWLLHMEQTDGGQIKHAKTCVNTDLLNWRITAWTGTVKRLEPCMNFWDATITDVNANLSEMWKR